MKKILLKSRFRGWPLHSLYQEMVKKSPEGFLIEILKENHSQDKGLTIDSKSANPFIRQLMYHIKPIPYMLAQRIEKKYFQGYDLVYASQHIIFNSEVPWITDLEFANAFAGYGSLNFVKNIIQKQLELDQCKFILPWSNWSKQTLLNSIDCKNIKDKIQVIHYTVSPKKFFRKKHEKVNFLFVGSSNVRNIQNIKFKSLKEVILDFQNISQKYDNIELTIRSYITPELKKITSNNPKITVIEKFLSKEQLNQLFINADVFVLPSHETYGIALLEAMSFKLPIIALNVYDISEIVLDHENGLLIKPHQKINYYTKNGTPADYSIKFVKNLEKYSFHIIEQLEKFFSEIIEDDSLRGKMAENSRKIIEEGNLSLSKRNDKLATVFESALKK